MKLKIALAMLALAASVSGASAKTVTYTFDGFCDGITMNETYSKKQNIATGTHLLGACSQTDVANGGLYGGAVGVGPKVWSAVSQEYGETLIYLLDQKNLTWTLFFAGPEEIWEPITSGVLDVGYNPNPGRAKGKSSDVPHTKAPVNREQVTNVTYQFADSGGNLMCDGLELEETSFMQAGYHVGYEGCAAFEVVSGPKGHVANYTTVGYGRTVYMSALGSLGPMQYAYVLDESAMTWTLFAENNGDPAWHVANSGLLTIPCGGCTKNTGLKRSSLTGIK